MGMANAVMLIMFPDRSIAAGRSPVCCAAVSGPVTRPTAAPEPRVMVSRSRGSSSHEPLSQALH
jgi:hypothetical protein